MNKRPHRSGFTIDKKLNLLDIFNRRVARYDIVVIILRHTVTKIMVTVHLLRRWDARRVSFQKIIQRISQFLECFFQA
jgi:hypothetical protein